MVFLFFFNHKDSGIPKERMSLLKTALNFLEKLPETEFDEFIGVAWNNKVAEEYDKSPSEEQDLKDLDKEKELVIEGYRKRLEKQRLKEILRENKQQHMLGMPRSPKQAVIDWLVTEKASDFRLFRGAKKFHAYHAKRTAEFNALEDRERFTQLAPFVLKLKELRKM